ncbi:MAG: kelch repeat-containing protein [Pseudomonadota bacterium]
MTQIFSRRQALLLTGAAFFASCVENKAISAPESTVPTARSGSGWSSGVPLLVPTQEIYPCVHNGAIHLAGGFFAENGQIVAPADAHYAWRPGDAAWTRGVSLRRQRHHPQLVSWRGGLFALAGFETPSEDQIWVMQSSGWRLLGHVFPPDGPAITIEPAWFEVSRLPRPCAEAVVGVTGDGNLHLAGGRTPKGSANAQWIDHTDTDHHYILTDLDVAWETAAPCLTKRNSASGDVIDGNLHIVGGRTVEGGNVAVHEVYDYREDRWRTAAPMPQGQGGLAAAAVGGRLYAFGGEFFDGDGGVYSEAYSYNTASDRWTRLPDMPNPRHGLGAVALNGELYVIGGALEVGGNGTTTVVDIYTP